MSNTLLHPASFRDPAGFIFKQDGKFYRQVNQCYAGAFDHFTGSGLYAALAAQQKIITHQRLQGNITGAEEAYCTLLPEQLGTISYPYEWCFSQWKAAALLTIDLATTAMAYGMMLKDATPFNIQFTGCRPILIDTLSFELYDQSKPWVAYNQFLTCFLSPLVLAASGSPELLRLFQLYPDGVPLQLTARLLPLKNRLRIPVIMHILLPSWMAASAGSSGQNRNLPAFSAGKMKRLLTNLRDVVSNLARPGQKKGWNNYYDGTITGGGYPEKKMDIISGWINTLPGDTVLDLGCNTGFFARAAAAAGKKCIAVDADHDCIEKLFRDCGESPGLNILPLVTDLSNPSPSIGWSSGERMSFTERCRADACFALALVHHLYFAKNISFTQMATFFFALAPRLIVEFVPASDPRVTDLNRERKKDATQYTEEHFLKAFEGRAVLMERVEVGGSGRILFMLKSASSAV